MGLGLEGAMGVEGAWDALHQIIAERKKDEILKQKEEDDKRQFQLQWMQQQENEKWRQLQFEGLQQDRKTRDENADLTRKAMIDAKSAAQQQQMENAIRARFHNLPIGYKATALDVADANKVGMQGLFSADKIDPANLSAQQKWTFAGDSDAQNRAAQLEIARTNANKPSWAFPVLTDPQGNQSVVGLNRRAVNPGASQIPIGNAPMPASQQQTLVDAGSVMYHVDKIKKLYPLIGDDNLGPVMGTRNRAWLTTGKTIEGAMGGVNKPPPAEFAQFNTQIAGLKNRIIRLVTGAAVQRDEEARIMQQVPDWTDVPEMFRAKLEGLAAIEQDLIQRIQKRKLAHLPTIGFEDQAGGGGAAPGAGADPDPYHINDLFPGGQ